ncbi:MAG: hypothetical protein K8H88_07075 [Sandaracinaceae bacterium]|nr:hypothetical protein [Sandaracinaceae bacterium]
MDELDPAGVAGPLKTGLSIVRGVQRWIEGPDRASIYRDHYEEWVADLARRVTEHAAFGVEIAERLDALEQDRERVLVLGNYGLEAWREAVDRRRAMLGDAAEATIFSELSAGELARAERTLRMLDPEDLDLLIEIQELWTTTEEALEAAVHQDETGKIVASVAMSTAACPMHRARATSTCSRTSRGRRPFGLGMRAAARLAWRLVRGAGRDPSHLARRAGLAVHGARAWLTITRRRTRSR